MNCEAALSGKKVLVTGATGFIGSRLIDYLVGYCHADVRALVRNFGPAVHIARHPINLIPGNVLDLDALRQAVSGAEIVFHCAAGTSGEDQERIAATVDGTRNMLAVASEQRVERFVYISTVAVHGPDPGLVIDEKTPLVKSDDLYADSKLEAEHIVSAYGAEKGLPITILRPTIVYGPRSGGWTVGPVNQIRSGTLRLIDDGQGIANQIYVDDLVQALLLAAVKPEAVGEIFLISGGAPVTWKTFLGYYADMLGCDLQNISTREIDQLRKQMSSLRNPIYLGATFIASPHARSVVRQIGGLNTTSRIITALIPKKIRGSITHRAAALRQIKISPPVLPRPWIVSLYTAKGVCKIDKAQRLLGFQPQVHLAQGMRYTEAWLRYSRLIPGN